MNVEARYRLATVWKQLGLTEEAPRQFTLFQEAKRVTMQVEDIYAQMNRPLRKRPHENEDEDK